MNNSPINPYASSSSNVPTQTPPPFQRPPSLPVMSGELAQAMAAVKNAANWWYWIAGITAVNCVVDLCSLGMHFKLGTGVTELIDAIAMNGVPSASAKGIAILLDLVVIGLIALWGYLCGRAMRWAFITGLLLYGLDMALILYGAITSSQGWLSVAFHGYALYRISLGIPAAGAWQRLRKERQAAGNAPQFGYSAVQATGAWPPAATNAPLAGAPTSERIGE